MATRTSVIGFPRIGKNRELKFASEKYFKAEISAAELEKTAAELRAYGWKKQSDAGITFIPSNDFSFYDNVLDTAFLLGAVPARYKALGLSPLETYFAAAHGYQGSAGDVKALPMKKWFNTNYHYIVPELSDNIKLSVADQNKAVTEFNEAKTLGIKTVPTVIGAYTFLHLATYTGQKKAGDFATELVNAYVQLAMSLSTAGAEWISIAEPALVFDVSAEEKALFASIYKDLISKLHKEANIKIILQTYFGDIRDVYNEVCELGFDAIGLDFVEGKKTLELVESGFPKDTFLIAGIVNGKNIWRADYQKKNELLVKLAVKVEEQNIVIGTSCSLLHVPYTTTSEEKLSSDILAHFAYAEEKIVELKEIASGDEKALEANKKLFASERVAKDAAVQKALAEISESDFVRKPDFAEREKIQHKTFKLPLFPTTTIGSFPQTSEVRANRAAYKKGTISREQYVEFNQKKIAECIKLQEELGLDVLVHGEFERNDMVEYFGSQLNGYLFTQNAWVQSYGTRCVKPPVVWGDVSRNNPMTVEWSVFAQSQTKKIMKGMLTGPVTILNWSFPREDISLKEQTQQIALAIREEVLDLEKNGIKIIQIDEAALREKLPLRRSDWHTEYLDWAIPAFRLVHSKVLPQTQIHTHMCYSEFNDIIRDIDAMDADVITFEASRADLKILDALKEANFRTEVGPGVYDIHSARVPSVEEITDALKKMLDKVQKEKLWVNPDCGLKTRGNEETIASLKNLVAAAKELRANV
ncbi:methionine synthase (B12-independent) [Treponema bryantii]|uniref:5-methyltetrahydropteroyltriglutamate--homocysteine methyltransferase n=1 Tax=Treponema bryantii TaxID=163 RepID=A0A1I3JV42_9SPIR|nr:5-methyltetrahydropteroyltriglutamate--homocysteine S-methyltransferase [Treponema bryantii]SFI64122.1 methionine synthase (B12-independent) [Treponema bryantii]